MYEGESVASIQSETNNLGLKAALVQAFLKGHRVAAIKTGFAEMIFRRLDVGCTRKALKTQIVQGVQTQELSQLRYCFVGSDQFSAS